MLVNTLRDMLRASLLLQKLRRKGTQPLLVTELQFVYSTLSLIAVSQCIKFYLILFYTFRDMYRTNLILQKLGRVIAS